MSFIDGVSDIFSGGGVGNLFGDVIGDVAGEVLGDKAGDLIGNVAGIAAGGALSMTGFGMIGNAGSFLSLVGGAGDLLKAAGDSGSSGGSSLNELQKLSLLNLDMSDPKLRKSKRGGECAEEGAGSIFEEIALALGQAMADKLKLLRDAADAVGEAKDEDVAKASAQVTARGQECNMVSQAANSALNSLGQACTTAARKA